MYLVLILMVCLFKMSVKGNIVKVKKKHFQEIGSCKEFGTSYQGKFKHLFSGVEGKRTFMDVFINSF